MVAIFDMDIDKITANSNKGTLTLPPKQTHAHTFARFIFSLKCMYCGPIQSDPKL